MERTQGVGVLPKELAINAGITGPMAARQRRELRYPQSGPLRHLRAIHFRVPLGEHGDVYDRYMIRVLEMRESLKILEQAMRDIPAGPIIDPKAKLAASGPKPAKHTGASNRPKANSASILISDGSPNPYRYRVRPPSLINLTVLEDMCLGPQRGRHRRDSGQRRHCPRRGRPIMTLSWK